MVVMLNAALRIHLFKSLKWNISGYRTLLEFVGSLMHVPNLSRKAHCFWFLPVLNQNCCCGVKLSASCDRKCLEKIGLDADEWKKKVVKPVFAPKNAIFKRFFSHFWILKYIFFKLVLWIPGFFLDKTPKIMSLACFAMKEKPPSAYFWADFGDASLVRRAVVERVFVTAEVWVISV